MKQKVYEVVGWINVLFQPIMYVLIILAACLVIGVAAWAASGFPLDVGAPMPSDSHGIAATLADRPNRLPIVRVADGDTTACTVIVVEVRPLEARQDEEPKSAPNEFDLERVGE